MSITRTARSERMGLTLGVPVVMATRVAVLVLLLSAATAPLAFAATNLARDYPEAAVFRQMARRGGMDFAARAGRLPASLAEIQDSGYTAYLFPTNLRPELSRSGSSMKISCLNRPAYFRGNTVQGYDVLVVLPQPGFFTDVELPGMRGIFPAANGRVIERRWHFNGASWLYEGRSWNEVDMALRAERIATHLNWMTMEYQAEFGRMPQTLSELESYLGTARNYSGWKGISEVLSLDMVSWQTGNLFVGWDHNAWVISTNLGPQVETTRWTPANYGTYRADSSLAY